jgi:DUF1680 family protein
MSDKDKVSRRQFVTSTISAAAIIAPPVRQVLARMSPAGELFGAPPQQASMGNPDFKDQAVENLVKSPYAKLRNIPVHAVTIQSGFWSPRREINVSKSIPSMHEELEAHGRMDNFRRVVGKSNAEQRGPVFSDSDVYKWTEAVGFALQSGDLPDLRSKAEKAINEVVAVQEPSGYLNTYYVDDRKPLRMQTQTQTTGHELYNIGHMLQGAIAYYLPPAIVSCSTLESVL